MAKRTSKKTKVEKVVEVEKSNLPPVGPIYLQQLEELQQYEQHYHAVSSNTLKSLLVHYLFKPTSELMLMAKDPNQTALHKLASTMILFAQSGKKPEMVKILADRAFGTTTNKHELTGQGGGAIKIDNNITGKLDATLASLTDEQLKIFEKAVSSLEGVMGNGSDKADS